MNLVAKHTLDFVVYGFGAERNAYFVGGFTDFLDKGDFNFPCKLRLDGFPDFLQAVQESGTVLKPRGAHGRATGFRNEQRHLCGCSRGVCHISLVGGLLAASLGGCGNVAPALVFLLSRIFWRF